MQTYSNGTGAQISDQNGYGGMQYGTTSDYSTLYVKQTVAAWSSAQAPAASEARLIYKEEVDSNYEFEEYDIPCGGCGLKVQRITELYMYNSNYNYWTMSPNSDYSDHIWYMTSSGFFGSNSVNNFGYFSNVVRPVIILPKSAI